MKLDEKMGAGAFVRSVGEIRQKAALTDVTRPRYIDLCSR